MMDELNGINEKTEVFYLTKGTMEDADGNLVNVCYTEEVKEACAKLIRITNDLGEQKTRYFIKWHSGHFVNPYHTDFFRLRHRECSWFKATENCFKTYSMFLKSGRLTQLKQAEQQI